MEKGDSGPGRDAVGGMKSRRKRYRGLARVVQAYNPSTWKTEAAGCEIGGQSGLQSDIQAKNLQWFREEAGWGEAQVYAIIY